MDKFPNVDIGFSSQNITNCSGVEPYNICNEYIVNPCIVVFPLFLIQPILMFKTKFFLPMNSIYYLKKWIMNNVLYSMMSCTKNKIKYKIEMNQFIYSLLEVLV
jgi:hypothetical protein